MTGKSSLIWSVRHHDRQHESFLVGTMHVSDERAFVHFPHVLDRMSQVGSFYGEVDLDQLRSTVDPAAFIIPGGQPLSQIWSNKKWHRFDRTLKMALGLDLIQFDQLAPILLLNEMTLRMLNHERELPLDLALWNEANSRDLRLGGLETIAEQAATMASLEASMQIKMLERALKNVSGLRKKTERLIELFQKGEIHRLHKLTRKDLGAMKHILIDERNERMAHRFQEHHMDMPIMAAIGAGHLSGEKGMIHQLKTKGLNAKPVLFR